MSPTAMAQTSLLCDPRPSKAAVGSMRTPRASTENTPTPPISAPALAPAPAPEPAPASAPAPASSVFSPAHTCHLDYDQFMSHAMRHWPAGSIRRLYTAEDMAQGISFLSGLPNPSMIPFQYLTFGAVNPVSLQTEAITVPTEAFETSLQYLPAQGLAPLAAWFKDFVSRIHGRPICDGPAAEGQQEEEQQASVHTPWSVTIGSGIQDLLSTVFRVLLDPDDTVLFEAPTYAGALLPIHPVGAKPIGAAIDAEGVNPEALEMQLRNWHTHPATNTKRFPKCLYTIPVGGNPHGATASEGRKRQILSICRRYNVLILEDDAYYFLSYHGLGSDPATRPRIKSYFALEQENVSTWGDGRVIHFDSLSKVLSGGLRIGFAAGPKALIDAMEVVTAAGTMQAAGPSMAIAYALLKHWGINGFLANADRVAGFYRDRRDQFEHLVRTVLGSAPLSEAPSGAPGSGVAHITEAVHRPAVAEWVTPEAGMFLWLKLHLPTPSSADLLHNKAIARGVVAVPGMHFYPEAGTDTPYCRLSYSVVPLEQMHEGLSRLRICIEEAWAEAGQPLVSA